MGVLVFRVPIFMIWMYICCQSHVFYLLYDELVMFHENPNFYVFPYLIRRPPSVQWNSFTRQNNTLSYFVLHHLYVEVMLLRSSMKLEISRWSLTRVRLFVIRFCSSLSLFSVLFLTWNICSLYVFPFMPQISIYKNSAEISFHY